MRIGSRNAIRKSRFLMDNNLSYSKSFRFNTSAAEVFDALVNPEKIKIYLFGTEAVSDWKVGSPLIFQGEWEGKAYKDKAIILVFDPGKCFSYSYWSGFSGMEDLPENYSTIIFYLEDDGNETILKLEQKGFANEEARKHSESNWTGVMEGMRGIVESGKA